MNYKKFAVILLCVSYATVAFLVLLNLVVDPYEIFRTPFLKRQTQVNDRYSKIEFLRKNKGKYNSYILGSSRMMPTSPDILAKYLPGAKFYNFATTLATPYEHLLHLRYFMKNGYPVKNLYIGLDLDLCFEVKTHKEENLLLKLHPEVLNRSWISYYWSYLSVFPKADIKRKLRRNFRKKANSIQVSENDGALTFGEEAKDPRVFAADTANNDTSVIKNNVKEENVTGLGELVTLCRRHEINLILFVTPHHKLFMDRFAVEDYLAFLKKLSAITSFWDFSGYNSVTTDNRYYVDGSHYKSSVSRMIAARIFGDRTFTVPEDFGAWVTKERINSYLECLRMNIRRNRDEGGGLAPSNPGQSH